MQFVEKKRRRVIINITSLIDVLFLLLIFFIMSSTFTEQPGMKLELPESQSATSEKMKELILEMKGDGRITLNQEPANLENLEELFKRAVPSLEEKTLVIKADKHVPHGDVVAVMDMAKLSGLEKLVIATKVKSNETDPSL
ncbi:MAG: biopolymer transporter ExbD [Gemmatimonadota bacterium]|nr:MAG: biopolymer transporter ExbD [Gemmatimonadota bacterium]